MGSGWHCRTRDHRPPLPSVHCFPSSHNREARWAGSYVLIPPLRNLTREGKGSWVSMRVAEMRGRVTCTMNGPSNRTTVSILTAVNPRTVQNLTTLRPLLCRAHKITGVTHGDSSSICGRLNWRQSRLNSPGTFKVEAATRVTLKRKRE